MKKILPTLENTQWITKFFFLILTTFLLISCGQYKQKKIYENMLVKSSNKKMKIGKKIIDLGLDIGYPSFKKDCREIMGRFLKPYGFQELPEETTSYSMVFQNNFWQIENSMIDFFPHISANFDFRSLNGKRVDIDQLNDYFCVDRKKIRRIYKKNFQKEHIFDANEEHRAEFIYNQDIINLYYLPLLKGEFTYDDYQKLIT